MLIKRDALRIDSGTVASFSMFDMKSLFHDIDYCTFCGLLSNQAVHVDVTK